MNTANFDVTWILFSICTWYWWDAAVRSKSLRNWKITAAMSTGIAFLLWQCIHLARCLNFFEIDCCCSLSDYLELHRPISEDKRDVGGGGRLHCISGFIVTLVLIVGYSSLSLNIFSSFRAVKITSNRKLDGIVDFGRALYQSQYGHWNDPQTWQMCRWNRVKAL